MSHLPGSRRPMSDALTEERRGAVGLNDQECALLPSTSTGRISVPRVGKSHLCPTFLASYLPRINGRELKRPRRVSARPSQAYDGCPGGVGSGSVSAGADGEGVEVVGEDRPAGPGLHPVMAFEPGAAQAVAAFEVADAALDAGAVAGSAFAGAARCRVRGGRRAGSARRSGRGTRRLVGPGMKPPSATISRGRIPARSSSAAVWGSSVFSAGLPGGVGGREDEPARAAAGVLGDLADLRDVAELGRLAELALADRPRVGVGDRHQPVGDLQPADAAVDLLGDLAGSGSASSSSLAAARSLAWAPRPRARRPRRGGESPGLARGAGDQPAGLLVERHHLRLGLAGAPCRASWRSRGPSCRPSASGRAPARLGRRRSSASLRPSRASALAPCSASIASDG